MGSSWEKSSLSSPSSVSMKTIFLPRAGNVNKGELPKTLFNFRNGSREVHPVVDPAGFPLVLSYTAGKIVCSLLYGAGSGMAVSFAGLTLIEYFGTETLPSSTGLSLALKGVFLFCLGPLNGSERRSISYSLGLGCMESLIPFVVALQDC